MLKYILYWKKDMLYLNILFLYLIFEKINE